MSVRSFRPTIIIPTKNRVDLLSQLLQSIERLDAGNGTRPEIIVADNDSQDDTYARINAKAGCFPLPVRAVKVTVTKNEKYCSRKLSAADRQSNRSSDLIEWRCKSDCSA